jgi:osmotically-inducible protein OsmY
MQRPQTTPEGPKAVAVGGVFRLARLQLARFKLTGFALTGLGLLAAALFALGCSKSPPPTGQISWRPATKADGAGEPVLSEPRFSEALLELRVRGALLERLRADALGIGVDLDGDTVILRGVVGDESWKRRARETAGSVLGVAGVVDRLRVERLARRSSRDRMTEKLDREAADALLEIRLQTRLVEDLGRVGFDIYIDATGGTVSLRGRVPDVERRRRAARLAEHLAGVEEVYNYLTVHS